MRWCVVRHPEVGAGVIPESALELHEARGFVRVSDFADDQTLLNPADHPLPSKPAAKSNKES